MKNFSYIIEWSNNGVVVMEDGTGMTFRNGLRTVRRFTATTKTLNKGKVSNRIFDNWERLFGLSEIAGMRIGSYYLARNLSLNFSAHISRQQNEAFYQGDGITSKVIGSVKITDIVQLSRTLSFGAGEGRGLQSFAKYGQRKSII
jgi:hypothetical protein